MDGNLHCCETNIASLSEAKQAGWTFTEEDGFRCPPHQNYSGCAFTETKK